MEKIMAGSTVFAKIINYLIFYVLVHNINNSSAQRLNVPRVLLPVFNDFPVNFTLEVTDGGCYQWSTTRLDIIQLIPIDGDFDGKCSTSIIIQTVTREPVHNTAIVLAEDVTNGQFLKCAIIVDAIFSLSIVTTARELYIEEAPEAFEVRAYDEQGNEFTTLAGIEFAWSIYDINVAQFDNRQSNNVLRFLSYAESQYEPPSTVAALDILGKNGHIALLEGARTGTAKISVKLPHFEYKHIPAVEVELVVVANLLILPSDVTLMAHDSIRYRIMQAREGRLEEINLSLTDYYLESENSEILEIDNDFITGYAMSTGRTKVLLYDKNVGEEYSIVLPSATVNVNNVAYISITILPNKNSGLILQQVHEIVVELYDNKDHKFHVGEGVEVSMKIDESFFEVHEVTQNGTYAVGTPIKCGIMVVEATLFGIIDKYGKKIPLPSALHTKAELSIHPPVKILPHFLVIPWSNTNKSQTDISLKATGGDGSYLWISKQPNIVTVLPHGILKVMQMGSTEVIVSMARNQYNRDIAKIHILPPSKLKIIQYNMETTVGEAIYLHIALYGQLTDGSTTKEMPFDNCRNLNLEVYIPDGNFVQIDSYDVQPVASACTVVGLMSRVIGVSEVTVAYHIKGHNLIDNVTISAHEPLIVLHPRSLETVLAVGSSRKIVFKGGPLPWLDKSHSFSKEINISNPKIAQVYEIENAINHVHHLTVFNVVCTALGELTLTYTMSNIPFLPNCKHTQARAQIKVICGKPRFIYPQPDFKDNENCPISRISDKVMAYSDKNLKMLVVVKDENGKQFDNITSLNIEWNLKPSHIGFVEVQSGIIEETFMENEIVLPRTHFQNIIFKEPVGTFTITASVVGYQKQVLNKMKITPEWPAFPIKVDVNTYKTPVIENSVEVTLVNGTRINPSRLTILNDPRGKYYLDVIQGSGHYNLLLSSEDIADIRYVKPIKTLSVIPKKSGLLHISLTDLCLPSKPAEAVVEVQELAAIAVETVNKVEKDKCIIAELKLYDTNGYVIKLPSLDILDFKTEIDSRYIKVKQLPAIEQGTAPYEQISFMIHGVEEGESQLTFSAKSDDQEIHSGVTTIQVFTSLKIHPRNLTILTGTIYQITTTGGPSNAEIEYLVDNNDILSVDENGIFEGKSIGHAKIIAKAVGFNAKGTKIVYSEDSVDVHVVHLTGVKIVVPTNRVKVGAKFPLYAFGTPNNLSPLIIGSMRTPLIFSWSISDPKLLHLHNMYDGTGINIKYKSDFSPRAKALSPGTVTIYLNVTMSENVLSVFKNDITYSTFIKIEIFEELYLTNPSTASHLPLILMAPNSSIRLQTNRDKRGSNTYKILSSTYTNDINHTCTSAQLCRSITVDKTGIIKSEENLGRTIIAVNNIESYNLKQTIAVAVEVKPVHYMMLSLKSKLRIRPGEELNMLPNGMELVYAVEYYDDNGRKFDAAETNLRTTLNRADLASFSSHPSNEIYVKFVENGDLVAKIHSIIHSQKMFDYVHMIIGDIRFPTKTVLTVGDVVCFSMPLLSSDGDPGYWQSSASDILAVDSVTGIGIARSTGYATVRHSLAAHIQGEIEVNIQPIAKISIVPLKGKNITGTKPFSMPLVLKSKYEDVKENNILARGLGGCRTHSSYRLNSPPYICDIQFVSFVSHIDIKDIFLAKPRFDIVTGFYYCDIIPVSSPSIAYSTIDTKIRINAQSCDIEGSPIEVSYLPPMYIDVNEVVFVATHAQAIPTATLDIYGLQSVLEQITINVPEGITVSGLLHISKNSVQYKFRLMQTQEEIQGQRILVINDVTKQNISLFVRISKYESFVIFSGIPWVDYIYFHRYTFSTFVVLLISIYYVWKNKVTNVDLTVKNKTIFVDKGSPFNRTISPCATVLNQSLNPSPITPVTPIKPFSSFEPVYGDPRSFYTPNARRNKTILS